MTDVTNPERGTEQAQTELPTPKFETPSPASPSSVDTDAIVRQVTETLRREIRQAQSTKDKEVAAIKKSLGISDLSELEALGVTIPENVKTEYRFRQLEQERNANSSHAQPPSSPGNGAALTSSDVSEVIKAFGLDANDAAVLEKLRGTYRNRDHFEAEMARLAFAQANKPQPSAAAAPAIQGQPASPQSVEALTAEYKTKVLAARGNKTQIIALRAEYKEKGVNVYAIDFT